MEKFDSTTFDDWVRALTQIRPGWMYEWASAEDLRYAIEYARAADSFDSITACLRTRVGLRIFDSARAAHVAQLERGGRP